MKVPRSVKLAPLSRELFPLMLVTQSCGTLCDPKDCSPPGSSVHGILQARIVEWVAIPFSRGSSHPRGRTVASCITGRFFTTEPTGELDPLKVAGNRMPPYEK